MLIFSPVLQSPFDGLRRMVQFHLGSTGVPFDAADMAVPKGSMGGDEA